MPVVRLSKKHKGCGGLFMNQTHNQYENTLSVHALYFLISYSIFLINC